MLKLSQLVDKWADENLGGEPDWGPLERALPRKWCGGFMWMTRVERDGVTIELYKQGITRHYLNLDHDGGAHQYNGDGYDPIGLDEAIEWVFEGLDEMGLSRETVYDDEFRRRKYEALREAGWTVISTGPP